MWPLAFLLSLIATTGPTDPPEIEVMSFNIRYGTAKDGDNKWPNRREMVFDVIREADPDFIGLQEALRFQIDEVLAAVPGYETVGVGRVDGKTKGEYAAIAYHASRFTVLETGNFWLSDTPEIPGSMSWGNRITRLCTWARFGDRRNGRSLYVYNTHFDHQSQPSRAQSAKLLIKRIEERAHPDPVIVTGDFNAGETNPVIRLLATKFTDTFKSANPDATDTGTFGGFTGRRDGDRIDYVFTSAGLDVLTSRIVHDNTDGRYPSDHYPILTSLRLKQKPPAPAPPTN